jgi:DHA2 family multidrug resistance protein
MSDVKLQDASKAPLTGGQLWFAAMMLAIANFVVVLDTTIANVSVPNIAGDLGAAGNQGTLVITFYTVAEAISMPLTGWLASRFGTVKTFIVCMVIFGVFSVLCGLAPSLGALVFLRILQGLSAGPLMPLSQTLLLRIFPKEKAPAAITLWSMTTLVAPVAGPILGGYLCDNWSWHYIFLINAPISLLCAYFGWQLLKRYETALLKAKMDFVGLGLLVVWVGSLQLMLDEGKDLDWFASNLIVVLCVVALIGFAAFMIWELTEKNPAVNLRVFRHRGYTMSVVTISLAFGAYFSSAVLTPLWLQNYMGYTATEAGIATAATGILAIAGAPLAARFSVKMDRRLMVCLGVLWMGAMTLMRTDGTTDMTRWQVSSLLLFQGIGLPFYFVPLTGLALSSVDDSETASAAGLMSFVRTVVGAFATSVVTTSWDNGIVRNHAELAGLVDRTGETVRGMLASGMTMDQSRAMLDRLVQVQSAMLATNHIFFWSGLAFVLAAISIWFAPKPVKVADTTGAH